MDPGTTPSMPRSKITTAKRAGATADESRRRAELRRGLLAWYRCHARNLPWRRRSNDPYAVWLAEMMLQQTQTATVMPYYEAFMSRFPTVQSLASADRGEILRMWAGLGYYRRAHQLHEAARRVAFGLDGRFPKTVEGLLELPGVGRYTAGAIASIAFGRRAPILDGNVKRVLARLTASTAPPDQPDEQRRLWALAESLLPRRGCGDFNQALMDLGATVCTPRGPQCGHCPLAKSCGAHQTGRVHEIPQPRKRTAVSELRLTCFLIMSGDSLLVRRRDPTGLWAGTWTPPAAEANGAPVRSLAAQLLSASVQRQMTEIKPLGTARHRLTHREVVFDVHTATAKRVRLSNDCRWLRCNEANALPTAFRKVVGLLRTVFVETST